jgi:glycosyltransferase involved in cell wall biosynthesis
MAIGRPIVTTDVPGCRECVDNGKNGFLVPPKDSKGLASAIEILLKDENMRLKMGRASREKMEKELSLKQVVSETMELYKEVLSVNKTHLGK